jgi:pimeloyl-ACP methyl ester carboxylesterase
LPAYEGLDKFNPAYWFEDWPGFVEWWMWLFGARPHSSRAREDAIAYALGTDAATFAAAVMGSPIPDQDTALELAGRVRCPVLVIHDDQDRIVDIDVEGPLAEATGGTLLRIPHANRIPLAREPVRINLALRQFVDSLARSRARSSSRRISTASARSWPSTR